MIGIEGSTGASTSIHTHVEVHTNVTTFEQAQKITNGNIPGVFNSIYVKNSSLPLINPLGILGTARANNILDKRYRLDANAI